MNLIKFQAFLTAVDSGSFAKTAEALNYTPSGISHMMNSLEEELGLPLLTRHRNGVQPTDAGQRLLPILRELLKWNDQLEQVVSEINGLSSGSITIGAYLSISAQWLPQVIRAFKADYPNIKIRLMEGVWPEVHGWMEEHRTDFSLYSLRQGLKCHWIPLMDDPMLAVLPKDHPLAHLSSYPLAQCEQEDFIMPSLGDDVDVTQLLVEAGITPRITFSTMDNFTALSMIQAGLGMSIMNRLITEGKNFDLAMLPLDPPRHITLGIAVPCPEALSPAAARFISYLVRIIRDREPVSAAMLHGWQD